MSRNFRWMKILLIAAEFAQKSEYIFLIEVRFLLDSKKNKAPSLGAIISYTLVKIEFVGIIIGFVIYLIAERFIPSASRDNAENIA